jgi:hypothetical protein
MRPNPALSDRSGRGLNAFRPAWLQPVDDADALFHDAAKWWFEARSTVE